MGTDIHFYVERRGRDREHWVTCDRWVEEGGLWEVPYGERFYDERNYDVFGMLAGVRNGIGFAGLDTGEGFAPIAEPRGIPEDCCPEYKRLWAESGEHTPSYCTVAELLAYDWTRTSTKSGVLSLGEYLRWRPFYRGYQEYPRSWSGSISGPGIVIHSAAEIDSALDGLDLWDVSHRRADDEVMMRLRNLGVMLKAELDAPEGLSGLGLARHHVSASWQTTYARAAAKFLSETMPRLWRLGEPENVRCLFFFDS